MGADAVIHPPKFNFCVPLESQDITDVLGRGAAGRNYRRRPWRVVPRADAGTGVSSLSKAPPGLLLLA